MSDSRVWRLIAVLTVGGIFYVGHGLHVGTGELPAIESTAHAAAPWGPQGQSDFFTVSQDGSIVYHWRNSGGKVKFAGSAKAVTPTESQTPTL